MGLRRDGPRTRATTPPTAAPSPTARPRVPRHRALTGRDRQPLLHGDRRLRPRSRSTGDDRARPLRPVRRRAAAAPADQTPAPMPSECDDGPFGRGTGGQLRYHVDVPGSGSTTMWIAVAGSENSVAEARSEFAALIADPAGQLAEKKALARARSRAGRKLDPAGRPAAAGLDRVGQAEPRRPHAAWRPDVDIRWTNQGKEWTPEGSVSAHALDRRRLPRLPVAVRASTASTPRTRRSRSASSARSRTTCGRCARSPTSSATARAWSCTRSSPTARSGTARTRAAPTPTATVSTTSTRTRSSSSRAPWR